MSVTWGTVLGGGAFGLVAAGIGGWLQRIGGDHTAARQLRLQAAAAFQVSVGTFISIYADANRPPADAMILQERERMLFHGIVALQTGAAAVDIAGPDDLANAAQDIIRKAVAAAFGPTDEKVDAFMEMQRMAKAFGSSARALLEPRSRGRRQKNGRSRADSAPAAEAQDPEK